jgi:hypothetical protein
MVDGPTNQLIACAHKRLRRGRDRKGRLPFAATQRMGAGIGLSGPFASRLDGARLPNNGCCELAWFPDAATARSAYLSSSATLLGRCV